MRANATAAAPGSALATRGRRLAIRVGLVVVGIGALTAAAWLSVPFYPVPLTMQTLAVLLIGGLLGPTLGVSTVAGYLALGVLGAPVFHNGLGGLTVLAGPTGGYLVGFLLAVFLMGLAVRKAQVASSQWGAHQRGAAACRSGVVRQTMVIAAAAVLAEAAIYIVGVPWLALFTGGSLSQAVAAGFVPFLLGDLLKTAVAVAAVRTGVSILARRGLLPL